MSTKDKLPNLEILKASQDYLDNKVSELKSTTESTNNLIGNVQYAGEPTTMVLPQATRISMNIAGNRITLNNTSATTENPRYYRLNNGLSGVQTSSAYSTDTLRLQLKNGHKYRFLVKAVSGTIANESGKSLLLYVKHTGMSALGESYASVELTTLTGEEYHDFTAGDELFNIYIRQHDGITCTNAVFDVYLIDLTAAIDATPVSDSANPVASGGVYTALAGKQDALTYEVKYYSNTPSTKELTNITWTQNKNRITINGYNGTVNQIGKISGEFTASNVTNGNISSYLNDVEKDVLLAAGHVYRLSTKYISGSFTKANEDAYLYVRIRNEDGILKTIGINNDKIEFVIPTDTMVAIYVHGYVANNVYDHLAFDVFLEDITSLRGYPTYFNANDYMQTKLDAIAANARTIGANQDAFWFITDYHFRDNEGHSIPMLKFLSDQTGINKLLFGGDAGGTLGSSQSAIDERLRLSAQAWADMASTVDEFYGALGNHEWLQTGSVGPGGVMSSYLNRYKQIAKTMDPVTGSYRIDNIANKIRYYFIQQAEMASYPATASVAWMAEDLKTIGDGWSVVVVTHYGYIPPDVTYAECGVELSYGNDNNKAVSQILCSVREHGSITFNSVTYDYRTLTGTQHVIGVFGGHRHHGFLYTESEVSGIEDIAVFLGSTDSMNVGTIAENGHNWYWEDGVVGGTKIERLPGTVDEQCFYAVQIDLDNKKLYITAIGGDHDYEGYYEPGN